MGCVELGGGGGGDQAGAGVQGDDRRLALELAAERVLGDRPWGKGSWGWGRDGIEQVAPVGQPDVEEASDILTLDGDE